MLNREKLVSTDCSIKKLVHFRLEEHAGIVVFTFFSYSNRICDFFLFLSYFLFNRGTPFADVHFVHFIHLYILCVKSIHPMQHSKKHGT